MSCGVLCGFFMYNSFCAGTFPVLSLSFFKVLLGLRVPQRGLWKFYSLLVGKGWRRMYFVWRPWATKILLSSESFGFSRRHKMTSENARRPPALEHVPSTSRKAPGGDGAKYVMFMSVLTCLTRPCWMQHRMESTSCK
jgi:hypothetical protein